jgi:hypothetical protein
MTYSSKKDWWLFGLVWGVVAGLELRGDRVVRNS